jgi:beta-N-acetylhexosaminidase
MLGIEGTELADIDRKRLLRPLAGGAILFTRNYESPAQLERLTAAIAALREPRLLIAVDHEGGRVQRFREGFTAIPPMRSLGELWDQDVAGAAREARRLGFVLASELRERGVDFSFTPVLDLDHGTSGVIGNRAFHRNPNAVAHLAAAFGDGLAAGGMAGVGKHFPGHGFVVADSHDELPRDDRVLAQIATDDLVPFATLIGRRSLAAIMPAHVVYPAVDAKAAGFSRVWLRDILRNRLGFDGLVISDDLGMAGALTEGDIVARADAAIAAGCDLVLSCNDHAATDDMLARWKSEPAPDLARRLAPLEGRAGTLPLGTSAEAVPAPCISSVPAEPC